LGPYFAQNFASKFGQGLKRGSTVLQFQGSKFTLLTECVYVACRMMVAEYMRGLCTVILADSCCAR